MTKAQAARMAANRAEVRGEKLSPAAKKAADKAKADAPKDLDDAQTQFRILNPETLGYTLHLPDADREIEIKLDFSIGDMFRRRVIQNMQALQRLMFVEVMQFNGESSPDSPSIDYQWISQNTKYLDVVFNLAHVAQIARTNVAALARVAATSADDATAWGVGVTPDDLMIGMDIAELAATVFMLLAKIREMQRASKNGSAAGLV